MPTVFDMEHALATQSSARRRVTAADVQSGLRLAPDAVMSLRLPRGACISVMAGRLWLTEPNDADDHFVSAGFEYTVRRGGVVVLESDGAVAAEFRAS
jgi:Protein of unknown function (DUF2917)